MRTTKYILIFFLFIPAISCRAQIEVLSVEKLILPDQGKYFHPRFSESGDLLLLTSENYKGLHLYDPLKKNLVTISSKDGAGYSPVFSGDGQTILFVGQEYIQNRRNSELCAYSVQNGTTEILESAAKIVSSPMVSGNRVLYNADGLLKSALIGNLEQSGEDQAYAGIEEQQLVVYSGSAKRVLTPYQGESIIWPSVLPDGKRILAYGMNKGAFICDMNGIVKAELGKIEAPVWAGNEYIAGMVTRDDGHFITGSAIVLVRIATGEQTKLSPDSLIAMYPAVSHDSRKIAFNTTEGDIYIIEYHIKR